MENENNSAAANGAAATASSADATKTTQAAGNDPAAPSHRDWNGLTQSLRDMSKTMGTLMETLGKGVVTQQAPTTTATVEKKQEAKAEAVATPDVVAALTARLDASERNSALKEAFLEHGITDPDLRDLIQEKASKASPTDVGGIVAKYAKFKPQAAQSQSTTTPAAQTPPVSNTGVAGGVSRTQIPNDILAVPKEAWSQLTPEEKRAAYEREKRSKGIDVNPFRREPKSK